MIGKFLISSFLACLLVSTANAEEKFAMTLPIGWGDFANHELCKVIIDTGGIECDFVEVPTVLGPLTMGLARVSGDRAAIQEFLKDQQISARRTTESYERFFGGDLDSIAVIPNGCEVMLLPVGCSCENSVIGGPKISCPYSKWSSDETVVKMGGEIPWPVVMSSIRDFGVLKRISE